jgi:hypothetical protein
MPSIQETLVKYNYAELTHQQLAEHMDFSADEQQMLTMFWEPTFNSGWIYLSDEMIKNDMGYNKINSFYIDTLRKKYIINKDFKEIEKTDDLVKYYEILNVEQGTLKKINKFLTNTHTQAHTSSCH